MSDELCPNCIKGGKLHGTPQGTMVETPALPAYFSPANGSNGENKTSKVIIILPDIFGLKLDNPKLIADKLAKSTGMDVWVADIFKGRPICNENDLAPYLPDVPNQTLSLWEKFREKVTWTRIIGLKFLSIIEFEAQDGWVLSFIEYLRREHHYDKVGIMGYCWGGGLTTRIAAVQDSGVNAAIGIHVAYKYKAAFPNAVVPIAHFIPEEDPAWDPVLAAEVERKWKADGKKHLFKVYPGTTHGFGSRPNFDIPKVKESWETLMQDIPSWFKETL